MRCWPVDLDVSVLDQQLKLFVSRHSAFLSEHDPGEMHAHAHTQWGVFLADGLKQGVATATGSDVTFSLEVSVQESV